MVVYAVITEQSIGKLLIAGIVPGILTAAIYCAGIYVLARGGRISRRAPISPSTGRERWRSLYGVSGIIVLFVIVVGGIYGGYFPATYAGAVGAFGAFVIALGKRRLGMRSARRRAEGRGGDHLGDLHHRRRRHPFRALPHLLGSGGHHLRGLLGFGTGKYVYLVGFIVLFIVLGCFIEPIAIMVMTLPIMFPVMVKAGFDPIWLGVVAVKLAEISVLTPPVGLNVFVVKSSSPVPVTLGQVFAGVTPFILLDLLSLVLYVLFPEMLLWLPNLMKS